MKKKKIKKTARNLLALSMTAALAIQALPVMQVGALYEEAQAEQEQLRAELASRIEDYPEGAFSFYENGSTVTEGSQDIEIKIVRMGDTSSDASVDLKSVDITAKYGEDYEIYYLDGLRKVYPDEETAGQTAFEVAAVQETEQEPEIAETESETEEMQDAPKMSLRSAFAEQTGKNTISTNWRGEYEAYAARVAAAAAAENEVINAVDGAAFTIPFAAGEFEKIICIRINDDNKAESQEAASLILGNATVGVLGDQMEYQLTIDDNEEAEDIVFAMKDAEVITEKNAEYAEVTIQRISGLDYYAAAVCQTVAGTAIPYENYEPQNDVQVAFVPGETEKTIRIPLTGEYETGSYFEVRLNSDAVNADAERSTVIVWLGKKITEENTYDASQVNQFGFPIVKAKPSIAVPEEIAQNILSQATSMNGVTYDTDTYSSYSFSIVSNNGDHKTSSEKSTGTAMKYASYVKFDTTSTGCKSRLFSTYYGKENWLYVNGNQKIYKQLGDSKSNNTVNISETVSLSYAESRNGKIKLGIDPNGLNCNGEYKLNSFTVYRPRYTIEMKNVNPNFTSKTYTSSTKYTTSNVSALTSTSWTANKTMSYTSGNISISPGTVRAGITLTGYNVYINGTKISASIASDGYISYDELDNLRSSYQSKLESAKYKVVIEPVYSVKSAKVTFESQNSSLVNFSGFSGTLSCTQIDKINFSAGTVGNQNFSISSVSHEYKNGNNRTSIKNYTSKSGTVSVSHDQEYLKVYYQNPTLKIAYMPDEVKAGNAGIGAVTLAAYDKPSDIIDTSTYQSSFILKGTSYDVTAMNKNYLLNAVMGQDYRYTLTDSRNGNIIPMSTRVKWTYLDKDQQYKTVWGYSYVFQPFFADTEINYQFVEMQDDQAMAGVTGTVKTKEALLFSTSNQVKEVPAVGFRVNIGGVDTTTDNNGQYSVDANFNKGEYVGAYLSYDTISAVDSIAISKNAVKNFTVNVNTSENLTVTSSKMTYDEYTDVYKDGQRVTNEKTTSTITQMDTTYHLYLTASGKAGAAPDHAEFYIYDKSGKRKDSMTKSVKFDSSGSLRLDINPVKDGLAVGDSFTVKLFDKNGKGYYEHHTAVVVIEKLSGLYTFNYPGIKNENDNVFIKAVGGVGIAFDAALDAMANDYGPYVDDDGVTHQMMYLGMGEGFTDAEAVYEMKQDLDERFSDIKTGDYTPELSGYDDEISLFGDDPDNDFSMSLKVGVIMDCIAVTDDPKHKGELIFNDYYLIANAAVEYENQWKFTVGPVDVEVNLKVNTGDVSDNTSPGVRWHFYADEDARQYMNSSSIFDLFAANDIYNEGDIAMVMGINGKVAATIGKAAIGVEGGLDLKVSHHSAYFSEWKSWAHTGAISVSPSIAMKLLTVSIPVWTKTWAWQYGSDAKSLPARMQEASEEEMLFTSTAMKQISDFSAAQEAVWNSYPRPKQKPGGVDASVQNVLKEAVADTAAVRMQNLGNGKYLAVFLDAVPGRDALNALGAYYTVFDGSAWSMPVLLEDDGTIDQLPSICQAGSKGWLIAWSDADRILTEADTVTDSLNALDLTGCFFDAETNTAGEIMQLTRSTQEDTVSDTNPQIVYYQDGDQEYMRLYYTKSEYEISDETEGEVVGDILNPYELIAVRTYDFKNNTWAEEYSGSVRENVLEAVGEEEYDQYLENWYGQEFLDLAPAVEITEELDDFGYWAEGTSAEITETDLSEAAVKDGAAIAYNHLSLFAYALDKGGMAQETGDQNLYLQIYNMHDEEYHYPIQITSNNAEISNIQFVRMPLPGSEGTTEATYLFWLENGVVKRINISSLVSDHLLEGKTSDGQAFYYINKTYSEENNAYESAQTVASGWQNAQDDEQKDITSFKVRQQGNYNYIVWTQFVPSGDEERETQELQLFAVREDTVTGEKSMPVQLTDDIDQYIRNFDCIVTEDGNLDVLANCLTLNADGEADPASAQMKSFHIIPSDKFAIESVEVGSVEIKEDEQPLVNVDVTVANRSLTAKDHIVVELHNAADEIVSASNAPQVTYQLQETITEDDGVALEAEEFKTAAEPLTLSGGEVYSTRLTLPLNEDGSYAGTLYVRSGDTVLGTQELNGSVSAKLCAEEFSSQITERGKIALSAQIQNNSLLHSEETQIVYGYVDENGQRIQLGSQPLAALEPDETADFSANVEIDFAKFQSRTEEDGTLVDSMQFYVDTNAANSKPAYSTVELTASAEEVELMNNLKARSDVSVQCSAFNTDGELKAQRLLHTGDVSTLNLAVGEKLAQNIPEYVNRTKLVWTAASDQVASVDADGTVRLLGTGTTKFKGYLMPADSASILYEEGGVEEVDNYHLMPASMVLPVEAVVTVSASGTAVLESVVESTETTEPDTTEPDTSEPDTSEPDTSEPSETLPTETAAYIADVDEICNRAKEAYRQANNIQPAEAQAIRNDDGTLDITMTDENGSVLDVYTIDPTTGEGTDSDGKAVKLPQTGNNTPNSLFTVTASLLTMLAGAFAVVKSGILRRKKNEE